MEATLKTLLTALLSAPRAGLCPARPPRGCKKHLGRPGVFLESVTVLGVGANAYADGRADRDGWRDGGRHEQRWDDRRHDRDWHDNGRHEGWYRHDQHRHYYGKPVYIYGPRPVIYPAPVYYGPPVYRRPGGTTVIIDLPPIIIR